MARGIEMQAGAAWESNLNNITRPVGKRCTLDIRLEDRVLSLGRYGGHPPVVPFLFAECPDVRNRGYLPEIR